MDDDRRRARWRLAMGTGSEDLCGGLGGEEAAQDACLDFLYGRESAGRNVRGGAGRQGGDGASVLTTPDWINAIHELFPKRTVERLEKDALERYGLDEMVTNPAVLARAQPNQNLLKAVLRTKHLMNGEVLAAARALVAKVVRELMEKLATEVRQPFSGTLDPNRRSRLKSARNFDVKATLRRNLKRYDPVERRLVLEEPIFRTRVRRHVDQWRIIVLVDESGSMVSSVIHAAVTAAIFHSMPAVRTRLVIFDTEVVDLSEDVADPVETLMKVQLGGGTDIGKALTYAADLVENPRRTIVVLITDFFEGGEPRALYRAAQRILEGGATLLGLAALDEQADPSYDREIAGRLVRMGAHVAAMTPGELAVWVAEKIRR